MKIICSPMGVVDCERPSQGMSDIRQAGFTQTALDTSICVSSVLLESIGKRSYKKSGRTMVVESPDKMYESLQLMIEKGKVLDMAFPVAIAPALKADTAHTDLNDLMRRLTEESIRVCGKIGCRYLVVQSVFAGIAKKDIWETNKEFYLSLGTLARENNVMLLLKNQCRNMGGHLIRGICSEGMTAAEWVDRLNREMGEERFGFCMDVGISNLCGQNMYDFICCLGERLKAVVIRECDGTKDNALLPFTVASNGTSCTDWLNFFRGLRKIAFDGMVIMHFEDTAAATSPMLRSGLVRYAESVAKYFQWQIEMEQQLSRYPSRVLFGAGNMCRNYMKCYGQEYPPLYTCDNNRNLWETEFCGLTVKNPECLKELPKDTAIFICNIYYREIEKQLRDMGLQNPIAFFNDEYMPTFYFDRLTGEGRK